MSALFLIGCGKTKGQERDSARLLYRGSLFLKRRALVEAIGLPWWIISAKYGLVPPDVLIEPYDFRIDQYKPLDRAAWYLSVAAGLLDELTETGQPLRQIRAVILAGSDYADDLRDVLLAVGLSAECPMRGLGQGQQMAWLSRSPGVICNELKIDQASGSKTCPSASTAKVRLTSTAWPKREVHRVQLSH
jgi:uncharacterized protein DUF6884